MALIMGYFRQYQAMDMWQSANLNGSGLNDPEQALVQDEPVYHSSHTAHQQRYHQQTQDVSHMGSWAQAPGSMPQPGYVNYTNRYAAAQLILESTRASEPST